MKVNLRIISFISGLAILGTFAGCKKDNMFDCFKSTGEIVTQERSASYFGGIVLKNNLDLYITQGASYSIAVEAGKNLQKNIKTVIKDSVLTISNDNRCNWVRSYDKPMKVHLTVVDLDSIIYQSSGNVYSMNTLITDSIQVLVKEGGGSIDLQIETGKSYLQLNEGTVDLHVHGNSVVNYISSNAYGPVDCLDLNTNFTYMGSSSTNDCYIQVHMELEVVIDNAGNVYYTGDPYSISKTENSTGKLIKLD